jgi:O-antigen/teichoic acid export membrane protein
MSPTPPPGPDGRRPPGRAGTAHLRLRRTLSAPVRAALTSGAWGTLQQSLFLASNAALSILLIRSLPMEEYGLYAYAIGLCGIGLTVMTAGLAAVAVKAVVERPDEQPRIMGALLVIREGFALAGYLAIGAVALTGGSQAAVAATLLAGCVLFARGLDAPDIWFTAQMRLRRSASIRSAVTVLMLVVRIGCVLCGATSLWLFLVLYVLESLIAGLLVLRRYRREPRSPGFRRPDRATTGGLVRRSWPLLLSGIANQVNLRGDVIVIQAMLGSSSVAIYAAASRVSEIAYFLPVVLMNAVFPLILRARSEHGSDSEAYRATLQGAYTRAFWSGVAVALAICALGPWTVEIVFGPRYTDAIPILLIQAAACPFVFMAAVFSKWIVAEDTLWVSLTRHGAGAVLNIGMNILLIPRIGLIGAALATLASYVMASYLSCFLTRGTRVAGVQMTRAMGAPLLWCLARMRRRNGDDLRASHDPTTRPPAPEAPQNGLAGTSGQPLAAEPLPSDRSVRQ